MPLTVGVVVAHDFAGDTAVGAGLGVAQTGQTWRAEKGSFRRLGGNANGTNDDDQASIETGVLDMDVRSNIGPLATSKFYEVLGRYRGVDDYYWAEARPDGIINLLWRSPTGGYVSLGSSAVGAMPAAGGELGLRCQGDTFTGLVNGVAVVSATHSLQAQPRGSRAGLRHGAFVAGLTIDYKDFTVGSVGPAATNGALPLAEPFDGADGSPPAAIWTRTLTGTAALQDNLLRGNQLQVATPRGSYGGSGLKLNGVSVADFELRVDSSSLIPAADLPSAVNSEHYKGVMFRVPDGKWPVDAGQASDGYMLEVTPSGTDPSQQPWQFLLIRRAAGVFTLLADSRHLPGGVLNHSIRLRAVGNRLLGRLWERNTPEPTVWHLDVADPAVAPLVAPGAVGLYAFAGAAVRPDLAVTYNDLSATVAAAVGPAVTVSTPAFGLWREQVALSAVSDRPGSTFLWSLLEAPAGSVTALSAPDGPAVSFTPDLVGNYAGTVQGTFGGATTTATWRVTVGASAWKRVAGVRQPMRFLKRVGGTGYLGTSALGGAPLGGDKPSTTSGLGANPLGITSLGGTA